MLWMTLQLEMNHCSCCSLLGGSYAQGLGIIVFKNGGTVEQKSLLPFRQWTLFVSGLGMNKDLAPLERTIGKALIVVGYHFSAVTS